jgi:3-hydroxyisobutyrate dehydrogenase
LTRIGLAGLGRMGSAIAERLLETGADLTVWNRTCERSKRIEGLGGRVASSLAELVEGSDIVLAIVADDDAAKSLYLSPGGLFDIQSSDALYVEMSTLRPQTVHELGRQAAARSLSFMECPVLGTVGPARAGQLVGLLGGTPEQSDRVKPVLDTICRRQIYSGDLGSAARLKLTINDLLISYLGILAEAMAFGISGGLDPGLILDTVMESPAGVPLVKGKRDILLGHSPTPEKIGASFVTILKDMRLIADEAEVSGIRMPIADHVRRSLEDACAMGWQDRDMAETALYIRQQAMSSKSQDNL